MLLKLLVLKKFFELGKTLIVFGVAVEGPSLTTLARIEVRCLLDSDECNLHFTFKLSWSTNIGKAVIQLQVYGVISRFFSCFFYHFGTFTRQ